MGTNSGDGYYQEVDEALASLSDLGYYETREQGQKSLDDRVSRYRAANAAEVGATIPCANCGKLIIKTTYHKKFCSNQKNKSRKNKHKIKNSCKDQYWNLVNPRGKFAHLA
jgi:hypothetical protein